MHSGQYFWTAAMARTSCEVGPQIFLLTYDVTYRNVERSLCRVASKKEHVRYIKARAPMSVFLG